MRPFRTVERSTQGAPLSHRLVVVLVVVAALVAGACGDDEPEDPQVLRAGELDIRLPDGWRVTEQGPERRRSVSPRAPDVGIELVVEGDAMPALVD